MRFQYHKPIPDLYTLDNPKNPLTKISDKQLEYFKQLGTEMGFCGFSYAKLSDEFKKEWNIVYDNVIIVKFFMADGFLTDEPSKEKAIALDEEFQEIGKDVFKLIDYLRSEGFKADLINPLHDEVSLRAIATQSNDCGLLRSNMCLFREGLNICFFPIATSIENLPFKKENDMDWVLEFCETCGKCIRKCPKNAYDENEKVLSKVCTAHREGCCTCLLVCPFYKKGYNKIKEKYDKRKAKL